MFSRIKPFFSCNSALTNRAFSERSPLDPQTSSRPIIENPQDDAIYFEKGNIKEIGTKISSKIYKRIAVMTGAGISVNAGIPDFRTPVTGLYAQIQEEGLPLPCPEAVFDINFFKTNPEPFYRIGPKLVTVNKKPTLTHYFIKLLEQKGLLFMYYTQNIDGLEIKVGLSTNKLVQAHGNVNNAHCTSCKKEYPIARLREHMLEKKPAFCDCGGVVKPDVVFFGENLPTNYHSKAELIVFADLLLVIGTGLTVFPFASLAEMVSYDTPRIVINKGGLNSFIQNGFKFESESKRDVFFDGDCDEIISEIVKAAMWDEDLQRLMESKN
ncbi:unnamed protein product [Blepharisma stoltei]|uniref:Deacetylase sirtuin-type domain-containing protein n=1 Tax=Blepharisma stoltei TaxID=1481888 RepID=A0AAU9J6Y0_9CILI|nr:unnamed protein product [Blepharisma stoltei]